MSKTTQLFTYNAMLERVVDGDTLDVTLDLGFHTFTKQRIRLARINAPEMSIPEGVEAKTNLTALLPIGTSLIISTKKTDIYGRYIGEVTLGEINLNDKLVELGQAVNKKY
jgi:endonuclease YncB( thermonuclease family)